MLSSEVYAYMVGAPEWSDAPPIMRALFCHQMQDRQFGREETRDAWEFYQLGWYECTGVLVVIGEISEG